MKILVITLFLFNSYIIPFLAQAPDTAWTKVFGGEGSEAGISVQQTKDGGYIVLANDSLVTGYPDIWLIKTDENGDTLWTKTYGGISYDEGYSVKQTKDEGYIITGMTLSFGGGDPDVWLIKTDEYGDTLWTKTFGGSNTDWGSSVEQTKDGGYVITGMTLSFGAGGPDVWLIKTDEYGDTSWTKVYGGIDEDIGISVQQTKDGGFIIVGHTESFGAGGTDVWLIKTDENGDTSWTKTFGGLFLEYGISVQQTKDEGYIIAGTTRSFNPSITDILLIKTDKNGDEQWTKTFGGSDYEYGYSVQQTADSGYIVTGSTDSFGAGGRNVWLIKTNENGDTLWTKTIGGSSYDTGHSVQQTTDSGYIIVGNTESYGIGFRSNVWLIKCKPDPPLVVANEIGVVDHFLLNQNYPNPFNPITKIRYEIPEKSFVKIKVYDVLGNEIATLANEEKSAGSYEIEFSAKGGSASGEDAYSLPSGIYLYRLQVGNYVETKKMILLK